MRVSRIVANMRIDAYVVEFAELPTVAYELSIHLFTLNIDDVFIRCLCVRVSQSFIYVLA